MYSMGFRKILVPHDGSKASDNALGRAIELAKLSQYSHIILFHVIPEMQIPLVLERPIRSHKTGEVTSTSEYWRELYEDIKLSVLKMLEERKRKCETADISAEVCSLVGYPSEEIIKYAAKNKVDIVVMGTTGLRGISKIRALGSVARRVSEQVECPILLVH
jgi:nucleotide-binding universal stress UspA family protein